MGFIPLFPQLPRDIDCRIRTMFEKVKRKEIPESAVVEFMTKMNGEMFSSIATSRVKGSLEINLPPLLGKKLAFYPQDFGPWVLEIANAPQVLLFKLADDHERSTPGISGSIDVIKEIFLGMEVTEGIVSLDEDRLGLIGTDRSNPIPWVSDLFFLIGPIFDRKDIKETAIAKARPAISQELTKWGC